MRVRLGIRNFFTLSVANIAQLILSFIALAIIARDLGIAGLGLVSVALAGFLAGSAITDLTLPLPFGGLIATADGGIFGARSYDRIRVQIFIGLFVPSALIAIYSDQTIARMVALGVISGCVSSLGDSWLLLALGRVGSVAVAETFGRVVYVLMVWSVLPLHPSASTVPLLLAVSGFATVITTRMLAIRLRAELPDGRRWQNRELVALGGPALLGRLVTYAYGPGSLIMFATWMTPVQLGLLGASDRIIRALQSFIYPLSLSMYPFFVRGARDPRVSMRERVRAGSLVSLLMGGLATFATLLLASRLISVLYGPEFSGAVDVLRVEALLLIPFALTNFLVTNVLLARQDTVGAFFASAVGAVTLVGTSVLTALLRPTPTAAAATLVVTELSVLLAVLWRIRSRLGSERNLSRPAC